MVFKIFISRGVFNQYIAGLSACLCSVTSSSSHAWMTPLLERFLSPDSEIPMTLIESSWIVSMTQLGQMLSALPAGLLCNSIGRKPVMLLSVPLNVTAWLLVIYFPSALMLGIARVIEGLSMGLVFTAAPIYLGEIATKSNRGAIAGLFYSAIWTGYLWDYILGPYLSYDNYTYFTLALNLPFLVSFIWQPESPYFYLMKGDEEKAFDSLKWLRDSPEHELREELMDIRNSMKERADSAGMKDLVATAADRKALTILVALTAVRNLSGGASLQAYATRIFHLTPNNYISPDLTTVIYGIAMLTGSIFGTFTSDRLGRRALLLVSCVGCCVCNLCSGTYYFLLFNTSLDVSGFSWIAPVFILGYSSLCALGLFPVCAVYTSELFTSRTRHFASSFASVLIPILGFIMLVSFHSITDYLGLFVNFYIFTVVLLLGSVYFYYSAPETKGKSFDEIRNELY